MDDVELLYAWREGDREAGDKLVRAYYGQVLGFYRLRVSESAEDLTQKAFLACTEGRDRIRSSSFRAYVFGIARNLLVDYLQAGKREASMAALGGPRPQSVVTPSGVVSMRQEHWLLFRALDRLPSETQTTLALFYVQGLKAREIADVFEIPVSTVTTRLARAREALRLQVTELRAPAKVRDSVLGDLDGWVRGLEPFATGTPIDH